MENRTPRSTHAPQTTGATIDLSGVIQANMRNAFLTQSASETIAERFQALLGSQPRWPVLVVYRPADNPP